ncbi:MAG: hypothetical protein LBF75_09955, partial [Treponema sp.]|nr:hypothetical protein [Treponema sp.]
TLGKAIHILIPWGAKKRSLASLLWGYSYQTPQGDMDMVQAGDEQKYRLSKAGDLWGVQRCTLWAKGCRDPQSPESYFAVYRECYGF